MAIERYSNLEITDIKNLIDSLGIFAASDYVSSDSKVTFYADEEKQIPVFRFTNSYMRFSSTGSLDAAGTPYISTSYSNYPPTYAVKTRNGLLLSNVVAVAQSGWNPWCCLIGKNNHNQPAVIFSRQSSSSDFCIFNSSAYGENTNTGLQYLTFRKSSAYPTNAVLSSQIAICQIPTCPDAGTSYIKNALGLIMAPWAYCWSEVDINDVRYFTNGYLAINDEA